MSDKKEEMVVFPKRGFAKVESIFSQLIGIILNRGFGRDDKPGTYCLLVCPSCKKHYIVLHFRARKDGGSSYVGAGVKGNNFCPYCGYKYYRSKK